MLTSMRIKRLAARLTSCVSSHPNHYYPTPLIGYAYAQIAPVDMWLICFAERASTWTLLDARQIGVRVPLLPSNTSSQCLLSGNLPLPPLDNECAQIALANMWVIISTSFGVSDHARYSTWASLNLLQIVRVPHLLSNPSSHDLPYMETIRPLNPYWPWESLIFLAARLPLPVAGRGCRHQNRRHGEHQ
jgi:hypothetical protein